MEVEDYHQLVLAMATQVSAMDLPMLRMSFLMEVHLLFQEYGVFYISLSTDLSPGSLARDRWNGYYWVFVNDV